MTKWNQSQQDEANDIITEKLPAKVAEIRTRWSDIRNLALTSFSEREWDQHKIEVHANNLAGFQINFVLTNFQAVERLKTDIYASMEMISTLKCFFKMSNSKVKIDEPFHQSVCKQILDDIEASSLGAKALSLAITSYLYQRSIVGANSNQIDS